MRRSKQLHRLTCLSVILFSLPAGPNVWHERWGEDYDAGGDACVKWTDKWAERLLPGGAREQWGDKWHEAFANGRGEKNGEV
jgi:hypothetical protein